MIANVIIALVSILVTAAVTTFAVSAYQKKAAASTVGNAQEKARRLLQQKSPTHPKELLKLAVQLMEVFYLLDNGYCTPEDIDLAVKTSFIPRAMVLGLCKRMDFQCHNMEHQLGAFTNCNHGEGLAVLHPVYYRHIYEAGLPKFCRFATAVWVISSEGKTEQELALAGIDKLADFIKELGLPTTLRQLGIAEELDLKAVADSCGISAGSYRQLTHEEILQIFKECC